MVQMVRDDVVAVQSGDAEVDALIGDASKAAAEWKRTAVDARASAERAAGNVRGVHGADSSPPPGAASPSRTAVRPRRLSRRRHSSP